MLKDSALGATERTDYKYWVQNPLILQYYMLKILHGASESINKLITSYFGQYNDEQQQLHKYTVLGCMESGLRYPSIYGLKALVSGCKTKGFRTRNQGF